MSPRRAGVWIGAGIGSLVSLAVLSLAACNSDPPPFGTIGAPTFETPPPSRSPDPTGPFASNESPCPGYQPPGVGTDCSVIWSTIVTPWDGRCEYGHDLDRACNELYDCSSTWSRQPKRSCTNRCPATRDAIVVGAACSDTSMGCSYVEGTCACAPDPNADAGLQDAGDGGSTQTPTGIWKCAPPPGNGCPAQRPPLGSDCVRAMTCDYGSCGLRRDLTYACDGATWFQTSSDCP